MAVDKDTGLMLIGPIQRFTALYIVGDDPFTVPQSAKEQLLLQWDDIEIPWPEGKTAKQAFLDWVTDQRKRASPMPHPIILGYVVVGDVITDAYRQAFAVAQRYGFTTSDGNNPSASNPTAAAMNLAIDFLSQHYPSEYACGSHHATKPL